MTNSGPFLTFDGVVQNPHQRKPSLPAPLISEAELRPTPPPPTDSPDLPEEDSGKGRWNILRSLMGGSSKQNAKSKSPGPATDRENASKTTGANSANEASSSPAAAETPAPAPLPVTHRSYHFRFSLEWVDKRFGAYQPMRLQPPRLPLPAQNLLMQKGINLEPVLSTPPVGAAVTSSTYAGRALAEWTFISHECQNFFDRRKNEGVPTNRQVETPTLNVEAFRRPG